MRPSQILVRAGVDVVLWFCAPVVFLLVYVGGFSVPAAAALPHLFLVALLLVSLWASRIALARLLSSEVARLASAVATSLVLSTLVAYYVAVVIGLQSWGRVISWELMASYAPQVRQLADALGVSVALSVTALAIAYAAVLAGTWLYLGRMDWAAPLAHRLRGRILSVLVFAGYAFCAVQTYAFAAWPWTRQFEPLSLTFFASQARHHLRDNSIDHLSSERQDRVEDDARSHYAAEARAHEHERRNLILIVVDALRPDHMGIYGYRRDTTPYLSRLQQSGVLRKAAAIHAACGDSSCGLLSLASSKFVHQFTQRPFTLQQALKHHGYRVHMMLSGDHKNFYNMRDIYGESDTYFDGSSAKHHYMNDDRLLTGQLREFPAWDGVPVMIQLHLMSAHVLGKRHAASTPYAPASNYAFPVNRDSERATNFYDNGVVQADAVIQAVLERLESKGYLSNAVVAVTADHGESLGEHDLYVHANSVREELLRIPFVMLAYGYRPTQSIDQSGYASQVDIAPTLLAEMDLPIPPTWSGTPLQRASGVRAFDHFQQLTEVGLVDRRDSANVWKYWVDSKSGTEYAFNLSLDPNERSNTIDEVPLDLKREWRLQVISGVSVVFDRS